MLRHLRIAAMLFLGGCLPIFGGRPPISVPVAEPVPSVVAQTPLTPVPVRVETAGGKLCNGVRLDAQTVATAAHCVSDGTLVTVIEGGRARTVEAVVSHPGYAVLPAAQAGGVDLARLILPVIGPPMAQIVIRPAQPSAVEIRVVTRSGHYQDTPCGFLGQSGDLVELSCSVDLGWSGAPVVQDGALVGILGARGRIQSVDIAQVAAAMRLRTF